MGEHRYRMQGIRLWLYVNTLVLFSFGAATIVSVWLPVVPEAMAVMPNSNFQLSDQWAQYIGWHESWRYILMTGDAIHSCSNQ